MTPDQEKNVLATLYDRLYDALTYVPGGGKTGDFDRSTTLLQMTKNYVLNPADYRNAASSINPVGALSTAFAFSSMVDAVPAVGMEWADSGKKVSITFKTIVDGANAGNKENPEAKALYDKAYAFLNATTSIPNVVGPPTVTFGPSAIALSYDQNQTAYVNAIGGYRLAYNGYKLDVIEDQRNWQAVAPGLQNTVDQSWNKWVREGKQNVETAENLLRTSINNAISAAISQAQAAMSDQNAMADLMGGGDKWFASYAMPTNWCEPTCRGSQLTLSSKSLATQSSEQASEYSSQSKGIFWSGSRSENGKTESEATSMQTSDFELSAELIVVRIRRPWLNTVVFSMTDWWAKGIVQNGISNGRLKGNESGMLPLIPTAFIIAKDVTIKANFTEQDTKRFSSGKNSDASWGWGWGPFSGGGMYFKNKETGDNFNSTYSNGVLKLPGLQVVAWVSSVTPASPPKAAP